VKPIESVAVVSKRSSREALQTAQELCEWLVRRGLAVALDEAARRVRRPSGVTSFDPDADYDLVVVLGGDGTLLSVARGLQRPVPVFGVNLGRLGFLTEVGRADLYPSLIQVLGGAYRIEDRSLFAVTLTRASGPPATYSVLNDAVIAKSALARIIELSMRVGGSNVARLRADGLIVSTPTGSTAYNLSAGGPILAPQLPVAVITPICPHTLSLRPLVVPDSERIEITLETSREEVYLTLDGQEGTSLAYRDTVAVERSDARVGLVKISGRTFYDNLRGKLRWGDLAGQSPETATTDG
jgi:NAD+ kinase